ncbi:MAG: hypothetical protein AB7F59_11055 [Bdellovibrionales bacterium]
MKSMKTLIPVAVVTLGLIAACAPQSRFRAPVLKDGKLKTDAAAEQIAPTPGGSPSLEAPKDKFSLDYVNELENVYVHVEQQKNKSLLVQARVQRKNVGDVILQGSIADGKKEAELQQYISTPEGRLVLVSDESESIRGQVKCEEGKSCEEALTILAQPFKKGEEIGEFKIQVLNSKLSVEGATFKKGKDFDATLAEQLSQADSVRQGTVQWKGADAKVTHMITLLQKDASSLLIAAASGKIDEKIESLKFKTISSKATLKKDGVLQVTGLSLLTASDTDGLLKSTTITLLDKESNILEIHLKSENKTEEKTEDTDTEITTTSEAAVVKGALDEVSGSNDQQTPPDSGVTTRVGTLEENKASVPGVIPGKPEVPTVTISTTPVGTLAENKAQVPAATAPVTIGIPNSQPAGTPAGGAFAAAKVGGSPSMATTPVAQISAPPAPKAPSAMISNPKASPTLGNTLAAFPVQPVQPTDDLISKSDLFCTYDLRNDPTSEMQIYIWTGKAVSGAKVEKVIQMKAKKLDRARKEFVRIDEGKKDSNYIQANTCLGQLTFVKEGTSCREPYFEVTARTSMENQCVLAKNYGSPTTSAIYVYSKGDKAQITFNGGQVVQGSSIGQNYSKFELCSGVHVHHADGVARKYENKPLTVYGYVNPQGSTLQNKCVIGLDYARVK